jgi:molybdate transport system substrate-binding protein
MSGVQHLEDLAAQTVRRVAIANPEHAPYGRAARAALGRAGVLAAVEPKLVLGDNVRQTLQYAETGNVDVAIVALALVATDDPRGVPVPDSLYPPIVQELVVIAQRPHEAAAKRFAEFVLSAEGRAILQRHRFEPPPAR